MAGLIPQPLDRLLARMLAEYAHSGQRLRPAAPLVLEGARGPGSLRDASGRSRRDAAGPGRRTAHATGAQPGAGVARRGAGAGTEDRPGARPSRDSAAVHRRSLRGVQRGVVAGTPARGLRAAVRHGLAARSRAQGARRRRGGRPRGHDLRRFGGLRPRRDPLRRCGALPRLAARRRPRFSIRCARDYRRRYAPPPTCPCPGASSTRSRFRASTAARRTRSSASSSTCSTGIACTSW